MNSAAAIACGDAAAQKSGEPPTRSSRLVYPLQDAQVSEDASRIVRAIMLKGATIQNLQYDTIALIALMLLAMTIAVTRFRRTLD